MERHIATWTVDGKPDVSAEVGELIIDGNSIEFYSRNCKEVFPCAFVGYDGEHKYKVFTRGQWRTGKYRTIDNAAAYAVTCVLQQNCDFQQGMIIDGIQEASFIIPELVDWLEVPTVQYSATETGELFAEEINPPPIILYDNNPHIEIQFESESFTKYLDKNDITTFILKNQPRLFIIYSESCDVNRVLADVRAVMQFFGLMIGHVSDVEDLRLVKENQRCRGWLYINRDYSYNLRTMGMTDQKRTTFGGMNYQVQEFFERWYAFYHDETFSFIRRMYFSANNRKDMFLEDILVQYIRILEGYDLRVSKDEGTSQEVRKAINQVEKEIKKLIFSEDGKALFTSALEKVVPDWKYNASHAGMIASWIASGYLGRKSLDDRIKSLDDRYLNIISLNARNVLSHARKHPLAEEISNEEAIRIFILKIVATRNYFSHYKTEPTDVLESDQMYDTLNVLKALIIMIWFSQMGMEREMIRQIMIRDSELRFQTMCLQEKPVEQ